MDVTDRQTTRRLAIVDSNGNERIVFETDAADYDNPVVSLRDAKGIERIRLRLLGDEATGVQAAPRSGAGGGIPRRPARREQGAQRYSLTASPDGSAVALGSGICAAMALCLCEEGPMLHVGTDRQFVITGGDGIRFVARRTNAKSPRGTNTLPGPQGDRGDGSPHLATGGPSQQTSARGSMAANRIPYRENPAAFVGSGSIRLPLHLSPRGYAHTASREAGA